METFKIIGKKRVGISMQRILHRMKEAIKTKKYRMNKKKMKIKAKWRLKSIQNKTK